MDSSYGVSSISSAGASAAVSIEDSLSSLSLSTHSSGSNSSPIFGRESLKNSLQELLVSLLTTIREQKEADPILKKLAQLKKEFIDDWFKLLMLELTKLYLSEENSNNGVYDYSFTPDEMKQLSIELGKLPEQTPFQLHHTTFFFNTPNILISLICTKKFDVLRKCIADLTSDDLANRHYHELKDLVRVFKKHQDHYNQPWCTTVEAIVKITKKLNDVCEEDSSVAHNGIAEIFRTAVFCMTITEDDEAKTNDYEPTYGVNKAFYKKNISAQSARSVAQQKDDLVPEEREVKVTLFRRIVIDRVRKTFFLILKDIHRNEALKRKLDDEVKSGSFKVVQKSIGFDFSGNYIHVVQLEPQRYEREKLHPMHRQLIKQAEDAIAFEMNTIDTLCTQGFQGAPKILGAIPDKYIYFQEAFDGDNYQLAKVRHEKKIVFSSVVLSQIMQTIATQVHHLHRSPLGSLYIGDIKLENMLYRIDKSGHIIVKLCDFGSLRHVKDAQCQIPGNGYRYYGTQFATPPEFFQNNLPIKDFLKADMWALGIAFFQLAYNRDFCPEFLEHGVNQLTIHDMKKDVQQATEEMESEKDQVLKYLKQLCLLLLEMDPDRRLDSETFVDMLHPNQINQILRGTMFLDKNK